MLKKLVSKALLSVVMDKDARRKLDQMRTQETAAGKPATSVSKKPTAPAPVQTSSAGGDSDADVIATIADALAHARAEVSGSATPAPRKQPPAPSPKAPAPRPAPAPPPSVRDTPQTRSSTPEREQLLRDAMSIQRQKMHVIDELDPAAREKLMVMAMYVLDPSSLPPEQRAQAKADAEADGLVDDLGSAKKFRPKS